MVDIFIDHRFRITSYTISRILPSDGYFFMKEIPVTTGWVAEVASNPENKCQHPGLGKVVRLLQGGTQEASYITQFFMLGRSARFSLCCIDNPRVWFFDNA